MSGAIYSYNFATVTVNPPGNKQLCFDNLTLALVTRLWADNDSADNVNLHDGLLNLPIGTAMAIQESGNHHNMVRFNVTAAPVDRLSYVELPVTFVEQQGTLPPGSVEWLLYDVSSGTTALVELSVAKEHLYITDSLHDADIQRKILQAQGAILGYLGEKADPTWTAETVDPIVVAAIDFYLVHLDRNRGEDMTKDPAVWVAVQNILLPLRVPALGLGA